MPDNIELNSGTGGAVIKTDDDGTAHWQYVKVAFGADNTQTIVTSSAGLPVELLASSAAIGKLSANSGVDIGDVDVTSVPAPLSTTGGGTEATALRVTIANDSTGVVTVDDGGGSITIDGTVTETNSTAILADTASMDTSLGTIAGDTTSIDGKITACNTGAVVLSSGTVTTVTSITNDVNIADGGNSITVDNAGTFATQATLQAGTAEIGKLAAGTAAIGKLAANSGVDIGDVDVTSVPRSISGPAEPGTAIDSYTHTAINLTTGANQVLASSAPSKQIWVYGYAFSCGDADGQTVSLQDEDDAALTGIMEFAQYGGISVPPSGNFSMPIFKLGTDKDLEVDITGGDVDGWIAYAVLSV